VAVEEPESAASNGKGTVALNLSIPSDATLTGSFKIQFPKGMILDEDSTRLVPALAANSSLSFTSMENNTWLIEITANELKSSTADEYRKIMDIAYKVEESVSQGTYEATITNLDFSLDNGAAIKEIKNWICL